MKKVLPKVDNPPIEDAVANPPEVVRGNLREEISEVFHRMGGVEAMLTWAKASTVNTRLFYSNILPKVIPRQTEISGADGTPVKMVVKWSSDESLDVRNKMLPILTLAASNDD